MYKKNMTLSVLLLSTALLTGCAGSVDKAGGITDNMAYDMAYDAPVADAVGMTEEYSIDSAAGGVSGFAADAGSAVMNKMTVGDGTAMDQMEVAPDTPPEAGVIKDGEIDAGAQDKPMSRKLIKNISMTLETKNFDEVKAKIEQSVSGCGGYVESSNLYAPQEGITTCRSYYLTLRIPVDQLEAFVKSAGDLGVVSSQSENVRDITLDYVDKTAYKESLQVEYDKVTELLEKAKDLDQVLALESKLSQLRYEINSYESQLRMYDNQVDYSTVTMTIEEVEHEEAAPHSVGERIGSGFRASLRKVKDGCVNIFVFVISRLPQIAVLAVIAGVGGWLLRKIRRRRKKKAGKGAGGYGNTGGNPGTPKQETQEEKVPDFSEQEAQEEIEKILSNLDSDSSTPKTQMEKEESLISPGSKKTGRNLDDDFLNDLWDEGKPYVPRPRMQNTVRKSPADKEVPNATEKRHPISPMLEAQKGMGTRDQGGPTQNSRKWVMDDILLDSLLDDDGRAEDTSTPKRDAQKVQERKREKNSNTPQQKVQKEQKKIIENAVDDILNDAFGDSGERLGTPKRRVQREKKKPNIPEQKMQKNEE